MFWHDHPPPRFHARYAEYKAQIDIQTLEIIEGNLPGTALALALALALAQQWGEEHRAALMENWTLCAQNQSPQKIAPLP